jgi:hypothetical protein
LAGLDLSANAEARKKPELIYAWIDCAFPNENRPPCQLSIMGDGVRKVRVKFQGKTKTVSDIPLQPGPPKQVIPIWQWWTKNPPINIGPGHYDPKRCMGVKAIASNASGRTSKKAKICKDKTYYKFK